MEDIEISEVERKALEDELNEFTKPSTASVDNKEEKRLTISDEEAIEQPDVAQIIQSVARMDWAEMSGHKYVGTGFLAKITLGEKERLGYFTAGHNLYDDVTKQVIKTSSVQLRFKHIRKHTIKVTLSKFLCQKHILLVACKKTMIVVKDGQTSIQPCREGLDFSVVLFMAAVDSAARFLHKLGLSYLQVASPGACSSSPNLPVQLVGFPQYVENSPMRILPGIELAVPAGSIPNHCYTLETEPGASGGSVFDITGKVIAVHVRGQNVKKGDQGNWGLGFDIIREELLMCIDDSKVTLQTQPGTATPSTNQGMPSIVRFLKNLKLDKYISAFEEDHIDMDVLEDCEPEELGPMLENLEVSFGHRKKIIKALKHETQEKKEKMNLEEKKEQMKKEQEREEDQLENIGVNETAAASNVKMSCGVIIKIIGIIVIAVIAVIAHYYLGYKGGVGTRSKWVLYNNSPGCGADFISTPAECMQAAQKLGFTGQMNPGRWSDKPPGCSAGTQGFIYFNQDVVGTTGITSLRSLCLSPGVNETAAASNVKMSCGVIIKIIGIIVIAVAVIAHYYLGYKGGVRAEEYIDESENIKTQFQRFASSLIETTKCEKIPTLSNEEIGLLKNNWHILVVNLLPFEADKIIKMIENISFYRNSVVNENESVSTMFKIFSSYAKMELISLEEVSEAFNCIGIYIFLNFPVSLIKKISSEAILRIHFPEKGIFFNSDSSSQAFCKHLQKELLSSLSSQIALKWLKEKLKDDKDIIGLENNSFFDEFPFHKVGINVSYAYPGSTNCIVNIIFPNILENPQETNALIKIIETVLKKIKFLSKSNFTVDDQIETDGNILRMKFDVDIKNKKWNWWKKKEDLKSFLDGFVDDVRKNIISSEEEMINILMENEHMTPGASQLLVSKLLKKDKFLIDIKTEKDLSVDTVRFKNIPVWPLKSRKLSELPIATRIDIQDMMKNNFPKEICEEVAENLDVFRQDNNLDNLLESLDNIPIYRSPYTEIIKSYSKNQGTIGGLQGMLQYCLKSTTIRKSMNDFGKNPDEAINDMICLIDLHNERFFNEWYNTIKSRINHLEYTCIANYQDFKKACMSKNTMAVLKDNVRNWGHQMKSIVQEGDQIWMWRDKFRKGLQYAHVGVYVGGGDMIHVSAAGLNGIIVKEKAVDIIKNSKCFIVRPDPSRLRPESGTPKQRAQTCLGLTFLYSVTEGSCEVFVNCVTLGIWTTDCATLQGRDHPHVDNTLTAVNAVCKLRTRQTQRKDLLDQLAARLLENGFNDANCNQHARVRDIITPSMQQQDSRENVQNAENVREPEDLEQSTESLSEIGENTTLGHNAETTSYTPNQQASSLHTSEDDADTNIRVSESEVLKESSKIGQDTATGHHTETTSSTPNQQGSPVKMHQDDDTSEIGNGTSLGQFLADIGLSQLQDAIEQEDVDFNMLVTSTNEELKDMGISKFGHRRKILDAARKIKGETMSLPSPNHSTTKMPEIIFDEEVPILPSLGDSRTQGVNKASTSKESYS